MHGWSGSAALSARTTMHVSNRAVILLDWRCVDLRPDPRHPPKRRFAARIATALQCRYILYIVSLGMGLVL